MIIGPDPIEVKPCDAYSDWARDPRRGVVTLREVGDMFERTVTFPDGSAQVTMIGGGRRWGHGPDSGEGNAAIGPDAAARRLAEVAAGKLIYCHVAQSWFAFDGAVWRRDRGGVARMIRETLRDAGLDDPAPHLVAGAEKLARSEAALTADAAAREGNRDANAFWDADPWRLGTPGGTIDLTTGALHPADPGEHITRATAVAPAKTADCPIWRRFLDETMDGDTALVDFLQRFLGYALTGETSEHALVYGIGDGGNGKSVLVNTVRNIFGDYAAVAAPDLFAQGAERRAGQSRSGSAHSTEIAMLAGARLVTASETEEGRIWADGRLKLLTGGDPVTARFVKRDFFTFTPRFKLIVIGNHMPVLRTVDGAIRRRLCVVPFATRPAAPDRTLQARLKAEWPAILRWMVDGCIAWRAEGPGGGLNRPARVCEATDAYLGSQDVVGQFLAEACTTGPQCLDTAGRLYAAWCAYAKAAGETPGSQRRFAAKLERHGFRRDRMRHARLYRGGRLLRLGEREEAARRDAS